MAANDEPWWVNSPPRIYDIVTGFFPETHPSKTWQTNPRPLLVVGMFENVDTGMRLCRVAYGTTKRVSDGPRSDLAIGNLSALDSLGLKRPTRFAISDGANMALMPWHPRFFQPWRGKASPKLGRLTDDMAREVGAYLATLNNLPHP